jgi:hypothetical protein
MADLKNPIDDYFDVEESKIRDLVFLSLSLWKLRMKNCDK